MPADLSTVDVTGQNAPPSASSLAAIDEAISAFVERLDTGCTLLVAYSGGGDSTALLVALFEAASRKSEANIRIVAATVDHGLRAGSDAEANDAGRLCKRLGISHHVLRWESAKPDSRIQEEARTARYRLLSQAAKAADADIIVSAHNLDDWQETLAMRRARDPHATASIAEATLIEGRYWLYRPLLSVARRDLRDYLRVRGIGWVDDPSNDNPAFERVRVRKALAELANGSTPVSHPDSRRHIARQAADILAADAGLHAMGLGTLAIASFDPDDPAFEMALLSLIATIGGRVHVAGQEGRALLQTHLQSGEAFRIAIERVVVERKRDHLYLTRELRGLPVLRLGAGERGIWDNRFLVTNAGTDAVTIGAAEASGACGEAPDLVAAGDLSSIPPVTTRRFRATHPRVIDGESTRCSAVPYLARFEAFLPIDLYEIASKLAELAQRTPFPPPTLGR